MMTEFSFFWVNYHFQKGSLTDMYIPNTDVRHTYAYEIKNVIARVIYRVIADQFLKPPCVIVWYISKVLDL